MQAIEVLFIARSGLFTCVDATKRRHTWREMFFVVGLYHRRSTDALRANYYIIFEIKSSQKMSEPLLGLFGNAKVDSQNRFLQ